MLRPFPHISIKPFYTAKGWRVGTPFPHGSETAE